MKIIRIISEWKKRPSRKDQQKHGRFTHDKKMVEAIVEIGGKPCTRHIAVPR